METFPCDFRLRWKLNEIKEEMSRWRCGGGSWCEFWSAKELCKLKLFHYNYYSIHKDSLLSKANDGNRIAYTVHIRFLHIIHILAVPHIRKMVSSAQKTISWISHTKLVFMHFWVFFLRWKHFPPTTLPPGKYIFHLFLLLKVEKREKSFLCALCEDPNNRW